MIKRLSLLVVLGWFGAVHAASVNISGEAEACRMDPVQNPEVALRAVGNYDFSKLGDDRDCRYVDLKSIKKRKGEAVPDYLPGKELAAKTAIVCKVTRRLPITQGKNQNHLITIRNEIDPNKLLKEWGFSQADLNSWGYPNITADALNNNRNMGTFSDLNRFKKLGEACPVGSTVSIQQCPPNYVPGRVKFGEEMRVNVVMQGLQSPNYDHGYHVGGDYTGGSNLRFCHHGSNDVPWIGMHCTYPSSVGPGYIPYRQCIDYHSANETAYLSHCFGPCRRQGDWLDKVRESEAFRELVDPGGGRAYNVNIVSFSMWAVQAAAGQRSPADIVNEYAVVREKNDIYFVENGDRIVPAGRVTMDGMNGYYLPNANAFIPDYVSYCDLCTTAQMYDISGSSRRDDTRCNRYDVQYKLVITPTGRRVPIETECIPVASFNEQSIKN